MTGGKLQSLDDQRDSDPSASGGGPGWGGALSGLGGGVLSLICNMLVRAGWTCMGRRPAGHRECEVGTSVK